jgi:hypothetical protein
VLQAQLAIVWYHDFSSSHDKLRKAIQTCVIMRNIIIKNVRNTRVMHVGPYECQGSLAEVDHQVPTEFADFLIMHSKIRDNTVHARLQYDLVAHLWRLK